MIRDMIINIFKYCQSKNVGVLGCWLLSLSLRFENKLGRDVSSHGAELANYRRGFKGGGAWGQ